MSGKWKRKAKEQARTIEGLERTIQEQWAAEKALREQLFIAKKDTAEARAWAERAELATAQSDGSKVPGQCIDYGHHGRDRCVVCGARYDGQVEP